MQLALTKTIAGRPATAFAILANVTDWPRIARLIKSVEILTAGPLHAGTRLREERIFFGHGRMQEMEVAAIEPPRRLRFFVEHSDFCYELDYLIDGIFTGGSRMSLVFRSRPNTEVGHSAHPFLMPIMEVTLRDELEQDLADFAAAASAQEAFSTTI